MCARLMAKQKALFYPTPPQIVDLIASNIISAVQGPDERAGQILDPCCGTGEPLTILGNHLGLITYGNELHPQRFVLAKQRLDHCLNGAREFLEVDGQFSVLFNNPPYDLSVSGERMEVSHIQADLQLLLPEGLGIWIIPEPIIDFSLCSLLVTELEQVKLRRFPQPEYDRFKQVVIFGRRRSAPNHTSYRLANQLAEQVYQGLPVLQTAEFAYQYPVSDATITRFALKFPQASIMLAELEAAGVQHSETWQTLFNAGATVDAFQPLLRLNGGHTAMAIAAGIVDGTQVSIDGQPHLIKGSTAKRVLTSSQTEQVEDGKEQVIREREILVQTITALNLTNGSIAEYNSLDGQQGFTEFLLHHQGPLVDSIETNFPPLFEPERDLAAWLPQLQRIRAPGKLAGRLVAEGLLPAQQVRAAALAARLQTDKSVILVGEMGVGKTCCSQAVAALIGEDQRSNDWKLVVVCPAQVGAKWKREAKKVLADFDVNVHLIGQKRKQPDGSGKIRTVSKPVLDVIRAMEEPGSSILVMSYQTAKAGARWEHAVRQERKRVTYTVEVEESLPTYPYQQIVEKQVTRFEPVLCCPDCGQILMGENGPLTSVSELGKRKRTCSDCGAALWQQLPFAYGGRVAIADFLNRKYSGRYNLILDEAHHTKGANTDIGYASADLVAGARKVIAMTGTLYAGKASSIFYLLYRLMPRFRALYGYNEVQRFIEHHGLQETITKVKSYDRYHSTYGYNRESQRVRELPGVSPGMITMLLGQTAFLKLADMGIALPPYTEERLPVPLDDRLEEGLQQLDDLHEAAAKLAREGNPGLLSAWLFASLGWVDCPVEETLIAKDKEGCPIDTYTISGALGQAYELLDEPLAKDQALLEIVESELGQDRGIGVYFAQVNRRDWMQRVQALLSKRGIYSEILRQQTCPPSERERWYRAFVKRCRRHGQEPVLLANGNLVREGLDLVELPTLVETGIEYRINNLRQRDRRSWRLTQERPVKVIFLYYENSFQETALQLVAAKLKAAMLVDGNLAEGLAAMELDDGNLLDALMKAVAQGRPKPQAWRGLPVAELTQSPHHRPTKSKTEPKPILLPTSIEVGQAAIQLSFVPEEVEVQHGIVQYSFA